MADAWQDSLAEGVLLHDGRSVAWLNAAAARMLGVSAASAVGAPVIAVLGDHRLERVALRGGDPVELVRHGRALRARGVAGGLILEDVSEVREARTSAAELLAVLSHELRTPATTVSAALEALGNDLPEAARGRFLEHARRETSRLVRLVGDLTVQSRPPRQRRVDVAEAAARVVAILEPRLRERSVTVVLPEAGAIGWVDEDKLLQVLLNLVENAAVHGPSGSTVELAVEPLRPGWLSVSVLDGGEALSAEVRARLFQPRHRLRSPSGGSGLGLYITRSIVTGWGGTIEYDDLGTGNRFTFSLPVPPLHQ